jgi:hypothetical protein
MSTNALSQVRTNVEWRGRDALPSPDAMELVTTNTFFNSVGYDFKGSNSLLVVTFYTGEYDKYGPLTAGFLKGCIQKYGTSYDQRFIEGANNSAILRWTNGTATIVAEFVTEAYRNHYKAITKGGEVLCPYMLRIFPSGVQHPQVDEYQNSFAPAQDTTGLLFTNFPAFLNSYNGPIWE